MNFNVMGFDEKKFKEINPRSVILEVTEKAILAYEPTCTDEYRYAIYTDITDYYGADCYCRTIKAAAKEWQRVNR